MPDQFDNVQQIVKLKARARRRKLPITNEEIERWRDDLESWSGNLFEGVFWALVFGLGGCALLGLVGYALAGMHS